MKMSISSNVKKAISVIMLTAAVLTLITAACFVMEASYAEMGVHAESYITKKGFTKSYKKRLKKLHKLHPTWKFTPVKTNLDWEEALVKMTAKPGINTIWYSYAPAYKSVAEGRYDYLEDTYTGGKFPAASEQAVRYFMDPRNFLTERNVFLFEDRKYHSYQKLSIVKKALKRNEVLYANAKVFVKAGKKYDVSPLYLAAKSFSELGASTFMMDGHEFEYNGIKYKDCYNAYNIGATDSLGAVGGLIYANGGEAEEDYAAGEGKSYGRKWSTPSKAIRGGARYLCSSFIKNNQATAYTEHFNVMNGLSKVGTHIYMSALNGGISMAGQISDKYDDYGIYEKPLEFYIPVYKNMPSKLSGRPSADTDVDNNYYLKKLVVKYKEGGENAEVQKQTFIKSTKLNYKQSFKMEVPASVGSAEIIATAAGIRSPEVEGAGDVKLEPGLNTFEVICKSSAGPERKYTIKITKAE